MNESEFGFSKRDLYLTGLKPSLALPFIERVPIIIVKAKAHQSYQIYQRLSPADIVEVVIVRSVPILKPPHVTKDSSRSPTITRGGFRF